MAIIMLMASLVFLVLKVKIAVFHIFQTKLYLYQSDQYLLPIHLCYILVCFNWTWL